MLKGELCDIPLEDAVYYAARDADATLRVYPILWERITALGLEGTFWRDMRAMPMVVDMMRFGMPIDRAAFKELSGYFDYRMDQLQYEIRSSVGDLMEGEINPGSHDQMSHLIYDVLRLQDIGGTFKSKNKKSATKKSTSGDILKRYEPLHPVVKLIIDWREYQKLKTTYADAVPQKAGDDDRVHATFRITRAATGRLSCASPNLMAQPTRSEEGRKVRDCYVAPEGCSFISGDYSQIEMRVAAGDAKDEKMIDIFKRDQDIHSMTASGIFKIGIDDLNEMKHRYPAKRVGFGILNQMGPESLLRELISSGAGDWTLKQCEGMIKSWFEIYQGIYKYIRGNVAHAKRYGYVRDMWGRIRFIPGVKSANKWVRLEGERQAGNAPIQSGAQGVIKQAMGDLVPVYRAFPGLKPLIQIHDDIVWECRDEWIPIVIPEIKKVMCAAVPDGFPVPVEVDFKTGKKWGSLEKWKQ